MVKLTFSKAMGGRKAFKKSRAAAVRMIKRRPSRQPLARYRRRPRINAPIGETKLLSIVPQNNIPPLPIQALAKAHYLGFILQSIPSAWDTNLINLQGILMDQGVTAHTRIGNSVFYKQTTINCQLDMNTFNNARPPTEFRVLVVKQRGAMLPAGLTDTPQNILFLNTLGGPHSYSASGFTGMDLMTSPLNKRDWVVFRDNKFTLSSPMKTDEDGGKVGGYSGKYACRKNLRFNLRHLAKTRFNEASNLLQNYDAHYMVFVFSSCIGKDFASDSWEVSMRGTTSYIDN